MIFIFHIQKFFSMTSRNNFFHQQKFFKQQADSPCTSSVMSAEAFLSGVKARRVYTPLWQKREPKISRLAILGTCLSTHTPTHINRRTAWQLACQQTHQHMSTGEQPVNKHINKYHRWTAHQQTHHHISTGEQPVNRHTNTYQQVNSLSTDTPTHINRWTAWQQTHQHISTGEQPDNRHINPYHRWTACQLACQQTHQHISEVNSMSTCLSMNIATHITGEQPVIMSMLQQACPLCFTVCWSHTHTHTEVQVFTHTPLHMQAYTHMHACSTHAHTHVCTHHHPPHTHTRICAHPHTHTRMYPPTPTHHNTIHPNQTNARTSSDTEHCHAGDAHCGTTAAWAGGRSWSPPAGRQPPPQTPPSPHPSGASGKQRTPLEIHTIINQNT